MDLTLPYKVADMSLAGILGMLLAIPSYTVIRVFAKEFFSQFRLVRKLTEKI